MNQHKHKGFTLIEVLVGFVVLSFIVVMVSTVMASGFLISSKIYELPNAYYAAQDEVERKMDELSSDVKEMYRLQNEMQNTPPEELDPQIPSRLAAIHSRLAAYPKESVPLFGKSVDLYKIDVNYSSPNNRQLDLHAGVVRAEALERLVPIIDKVTIKSKAAPDKPDLYFAAGTEAEVSVDYNSKNNQYKYKDMYQWYIGTAGFHTAEFTRGTPANDELPYGTLYGVYPNHFTPLTGETKSVIKIKESYYGQMLLCVVTPLSKNGAMGRSVISNALYISALPKLSSGQYRMLIDASSHVFDYTASDTLQISSLPSRNSLTPYLSASGSYRPAINMVGSATDTDLSSAPVQNGVHSRYISFNTGTYMTASAGWSGAQAFVVARNNNSANVNFIGSGSSMTAGFSTNIRETDGSGDTGWQLLQVNLPSSAFTVGKSRVDVAELIVVTGASASEKEKIWNYLLQKYNIEDND